MRSYRCRICHECFEANPRGRLPNACPEHRERWNAERNAERHRDVYRGLVELPLSCCVDSQSAGTGRVCPQHKLWAKLHDLRARQVFRDLSPETIDQLTRLAGASKVERRADVTGLDDMATLIVWKTMESVSPINPPKIEGANTPGLDGGRS